MEHLSKLNRCKCPLCERWRKLGFPLPGPNTDLTESQYALQSRAFSVSILRQFVALNALLKRFEQVIRKRWRNKNAKSRSQLLERSLPGIASRRLLHPPQLADVVVRDGVKAFHLPPENRTRTAFLCPDLNLEDLVHGDHLLMLLNSRGRVHPHQFYFSDLIRSDFGHTTPPTYLGPKMRLYGSITPTSYGRIYHLRDLGLKERKLYQHCLTDPGTGLLLLEAQDLIFSFLLTCSHEILHDIPNRRMPTVPSQTKPSSFGQSTSLPGLSVAAMTRARGYLPPEQFNICRFIDLVEARLATARDHVHAMREDPGYFTEILMHWGEHSPERIPDKAGRTTTGLNTEASWKEITIRACGHAYTSLSLWGHIRNYVFAFGKASSDGVMDPIATSMNTLIHALVEIIMRALRCLEDGAFAAPALRKSYALGTKHSFLHELSDAAKDHGLMRLPLLPLGSANALIKEFGLILALLIATRHQKSEIRTCELRKRVQLLQHCIDKPSVEPLISTWIQSHFSDVALAVDLLHEIQKCQPAGISYGIAGPSQVMVRDDHECLRIHRNMDHVISVHLENAKLEHPIDRYFYYPSHKRRSAANINAMRQAEGRLDDFWSALNVPQDGFAEMPDIVQAILKGLETECRDRHNFLGDDPTKGYNAMHIALLSNDITVPRNVARTDAWGNLTLPESSGTNVPPQEGSGPKLAHSSKPDTTTGRQYASDIREKTKTRSLTQATSTHEDIELQNEEAETKAAVVRSITISRRTLKYITPLFFQPSGSDIPPDFGEMSWHDFLRAMTGIGFSSQKLWGSEWLFVPTEKSGIKRPITFHEPHGHDAKMSYKMVRRLGRRLNRAYGWEASTFVAVEGGKQETE